MEQVLKKYSVSVAKENLSRLLSGVESNGRSFVISRYGKPVALVSHYEENSKVKPKLKGSLHSYANPKLREQEEGAWKRTVCLK